MKTTDQRAGEALARAVIMRLILEVDVEGDAFADEGNALLDADPRDWPALSAWNKRACAWLFDRNVARGKLKP